MIAWNPQTDKYFITSECGYVVSKAFVLGVPVYSAWPPNRRPETPPFASEKTVQQAKDACVEHAKSLMNDQHSNKTE